MDLKSFLPSAPKLAQETVAVLLATLGAAWIISKVPAFKTLVNGNSVPSPLNNLEI